MKEDLLDSIIEWFLFIYPELDVLSVAVVPEHFFRLKIPLSLYELEVLTSSLKELFITIDHSQCLILSSFPIEYERTIHWISLVFLGGEYITCFCMLKKTSALSDPKFYNDDGLIPNFDVRNSRIPNLGSVPLPPYNYFMWMGKKVRLVVCKDVELERSHGLREVDIVIFVADTCGVFQTHFNAKQCFIADPFYLDGSVCSYDRVNDWMLVFQKGRSHRSSQSKPVYSTVSIILKNPLFMLSPIITWVYFCDTYLQTSESRSNVSLIKKAKTGYQDAHIEQDFYMRLMGLCLSIFDAPVRSYDDLVFILRIIEMIENRGAVHFDDKIERFRKRQLSDAMIIAFASLMVGGIVLMNYNTQTDGSDIGNIDHDIPKSSVNSLSL